MISKIMYVECKGDDIVGDGRISRVEFSKTGKTIYYKGHELQSLKGEGYKSNYYNIKSGCEYWISGPRKDGQDTLYPDIVEIDEDIRVEYWLKIRNSPESVNETKFRSEGTHSKWRKKQFKR